MNLQLACLLLLITTCASSLSGIELFLKNGDRLIGELVVESDEHLTILHPVLGEIELAKSALAEVPHFDESEIQPGTTKMDPDSVTENTPKVPETGQPSKLPPLDKTDESLAKKIPKYVWNSPKELVHAHQRMNAKLGFSFTDTANRRNQTDLRLFYGSKWENGKSEYRFDTDYRYRKTDGDVSDDRYIGDFRFRNQRQRDLFIQASSSYKKDPIRKINNWIEQGVGVGWKKKVSPAFEYSMGGETSVKWEDLFDDNQSIGGYNFLTSVFQDSILSISENYQLVQEAETYINPDDTENWGYRIEFNIDGKITSGFTIRFGYEYNFTNLVPRNVPQEETLFSSSLLYTF